MNNLHTPVLLNESINILGINPNGIYVDATAGMGGHSSKILEKLVNGKLICLDQDNFAIEFLTKKFKDFKNVNVIQSNFSNICEILKQLNINKVDGILADLGVSSPMFDDPQRGFSYKYDARLDMRMNQNQKLDAWFVVNKYDLKQLTNIFITYADAKEAKKVASGIINYRKNKMIDSTMELVEIIKSCVNKKTIFKHKHPARIYFQAIRMEVNNELNNLKKFLISALDLLNKKGILAVISYHSLEDRLIKNTFNEAIRTKIPLEVPILKDDINYELVNKHPIIATQSELETNFRARSAKLRAIKRIKEEN